MKVKIKKRASVLKYIGIGLFIALAFFAFSGAKKKGAKKELVFGMTVRDATPPYAQAMIYGAERVGKELGARIVVIDSQNDVLKQLEQMDSLLSRWAWTASSSAGRSIRLQSFRG